MKKKTFIDSGVVLLDQGLMSLATFVIGVLLARTVSTEEYGIFVLGWSLINIIQAVQHGLVVLPFTVNCPKMTLDEQGRHLGSGLIHSLILGILFLSAFTIASTERFIAEYDLPEDLFQTLPLISLVILPFLFREQFRSATIAQLDFLGSAKVNITASLLIIIISTFLYKKQMLELHSAYMLLATTSLLASLILLLRQRKHLHIKANFIWTDLKYNLKIGKWITLNTFAYTIISQVYPWLLLWFYDSSTVAIFGACLAIAGVLTPFLRGVTTYALPRMSHGHSKDPLALTRMLWKTMIILTIPFGIWTIVGSIFAEHIMTFFYTNKYQGYGLILSLLIFKKLVDSVSSPTTSALQAIHRPEVTTASLVLGASLTLVFGIYLIKEFGLIGAGISSIFSSLGTAIFRLYYIKKLINQ